MLTETLRLLFTRDLTRLRKEVELYQHEANLWKTEGVIPNSAGNLCLHLVGNLNTHVGRVLGNTGYIRNRELEFSAQDVPRHELLRMIDDTIHMVNDVLSHLDEGTLTSEYPLLVFEEKTSAEYMLVHLATHLAYHLGQVNYHRRLIDR